MEGCPARFGAISQLFPEQASEIKSRYWQNGYQAHTRTELICPEPRRATRAPYVLDGLNRSCSRPKGMMQMHRGEFEILDIILNKDDGDLDTGNQMSFFCGSPPVRTSNPIVHDAVFVKQSLCQVSPLGPISPGSKLSLARMERVERGSPSCGSSLGPKPKVRIEGFTCGNSEPHCVVPAFA
ncbi:hypothetical protein IHE45_10G003300 [Dioscorea alata]|uniref:Uncharacterized protein n=1 Tax=Dioscorea alata TaxID=55571 RepID=A0ACB7V992_DIOAL|nr:hypothetical protein IHE45_10G003300 [Dioscorea alata]